MSYAIPYTCISHIGRCRRMNQDNFICAGQYMDLGDEYGLATWDPASDPLPDPCVVKSGLTSDEPALLGIFDGMGGEECGEMAALLAAKEAAGTPLGGDLEETLTSLCQRANVRICRFADQNGVQVMGTTAAMLAFGPGDIALCNIGDSRIYCFSDDKLVRLSTDHVCAVPYGKKPPLSQHLGIPPTEMLIEPYTSKQDYREGDIYLICSDGLTDMVPPEEITEILGSIVSQADGSEFRTMRRAVKAAGDSLEAAARRLLERALANGGKDNITILVCRILSPKAS